MAKPPRKAKRGLPPPQSRLWRRAKKYVWWTVTLGVLAAILYGLSQTAGVAYSERDIRVVDFSFLDDSQKRTALQAANRARCPCGCGMTLAQCVSTDSTCPLREENVGKIRVMAQEAAN